MSSLFPGITKKTRTRIRYADTRVRRLRQALKLTKAELARRAGLNPSEFAHFEGPTKPKHRWNRSPAVRMVSTAHLSQLAIALGTTPDYIATGKADITVVAPNHPSRGMLKEVERERRARERLERRLTKMQTTYESLLTDAQRLNAKNAADLVRATERNATLNQMFNALRNERDIAVRLAETAAEAREDDAHYIIGVCAVDTPRDAIGDAEAFAEIRRAALRMLAGEPARPNLERIATEARELASSTGSMVCG